MAFVIILAATLGIIFGVRSCKKNSLSEFKGDFTYDAEVYKTTSKVLYDAEIVGTTKPVKPVKEVKNEADAFTGEAIASVFAGDAARYPTYGSTLSHVIGTGAEQVAARNAIIAEAGYLCAWGTANANSGGDQTPDKYTKIDKDGYLYQYLDDKWVHSVVRTSGGYGEDYRQLYKHTAAQGMYLEGYEKSGVTYEVSDKAQRVIKSVTMRPRGYNSYGITGLYAPAGEVIKVELSGKDMRATGGITVHIGQALYNGQANNIWSGKNQMQRFPLILNTLALNAKTCEYDEKNDVYTGYIGSFIGGPIYIRNTTASAKVTISGGVEYLHFILGYTTKAEFDRLKKTSTVPYFDLEVWELGVLHSGPRYYAESFDYDELYKAAVLWDKVSNVTTTNGTKQGIVFLYDPFVAAGAAVAFPGRSSVNCPAGWMTSSLDYDAIVSSGSWGNFHEYHHNFQNYGVGDRGEVTNNALTLVSYSLFTKISAARQLGAYGGAGLSGWNQYTSATWALQRVNTDQINSTNGLAVYATLLHNFGQDAFIGARGQSGAAYFNKWAELTHQDFSYYQSLVGSYAVDSAPAATEYPLFVPVSSVYQTGRTYLFDNERREINTMQPYVIPEGKPFTVDLRPYAVNDSGQYQSGSIVIGNGLKYNIKNIDTSDLKGTFTKVDGDVYTFTPSASDTLSGKVYVTLEITTESGANEWNGHALPDVDLILQFKQSKEFNKQTLERTTYTYSADKMYSDATEAFKAGFAGATGTVEKADQSNPTQNANTDIWYRPDDEATHQKFPNDPDRYFIHDNTIEVIDGKLLFSDNGKYRVYLRGRSNCALYYSFDGKDYSLGARITADTPVNGGKTYWFRTDPSTYFDVEVTDDPEGNGYKYTITRPSGESTEKLGEGTVTGTRWLHIKEVLIVQKSASSFIGVGLQQWTEPQFTQSEKYYTDKAMTREITAAEYNALTESEKSKIYIKTLYYDNAGREVPEEDVANAKISAPTLPKVDKQMPYVNAYRSDYEFEAAFESDYFYKREYTYSFSQTSGIKSHKLVDSTTFTKYVKDEVSYGIENLFNPETSVHMQNSELNELASKPFAFTADAVDTVVANTVTITGTNGATPGEFTLFVGESKDDLKEVTLTLTRNGTTSVTAKFDPVRFRYYRLTVTKTIRGDGELDTRYISITGLTFGYSVSGGKVISPDSKEISYDGKWSAARCDSTFGHVRIGKRKAEMTFDFDGTAFKIISSKKYGGDFTVYIDGVKTAGKENLEDNGAYYVSYFADGLSEGKHTVRVVCAAESSVDSVVVI